MMMGLVSEKDQKKMQKMLDMGYSADEVVNHFMEDAEKKGGNMGLTRKLMSLMNEDLTDDQAIELMREELGEKSQKKMEELIKQGYSAKEVMQKMMAEGQTKEEELKETAEKMKEMLAQGIPLQEVLDTFVKQFEEEEELTGMEKKVRDAKDAAAAAGKELSQYQI